MNKITAAKIETLLHAIADNYRARNDPNPELAAKYQLEIVLRWGLSQPPHFIDQLLDWELEDTLKARVAILDGTEYPR